jgi:hypothetical protein
MTILNECHRAGREDFKKSIGQREDLAMSFYRNTHLIIAIALPIFGFAGVSLSEEIPTLQQLDRDSAHTFVSPFAGDNRESRGESVQQERSGEQREIEKLARENQQIDRALQTEICKGC